MSALRVVIVPLLASLAGLLGGCSQSNTGDVDTSNAGVPVGIQRFLLFPNPIVEPPPAAQQPETFQTNTTAYAQAYYKAIDPSDSRDTLEKWKNENHFGQLGGQFGGEEHTAVFRDTRDVGYGRRMTGRYEPGPSGRVAFFVDNYQVTNIGGGYSAVNLDAAVARDAKWHIFTNAMEWSCHPNAAPCAVKFAKFYSFAPDGRRQLTLDMDGHGQKAMPGPCATCHGGRGDPLDSNQEFARVANTQLEQPGDVQGKLHAFDVDSFEFSTTAGLTRADQEASLRDFNLWVLCSYPLPVGLANPGGVDACRSNAGPNEWQGKAAAELIKAWYGGTDGSNNLNNTTFSDTYLPGDWDLTATHANLYRQVVAPYCRTCHIVRGTGKQSDIDFASEAKFKSYADRTKVHVFDRGNMPLAELVYLTFWKSLAPNTLASYIDSALGTGTATAAGGAALRPGRPVADPGPKRMVKMNVDTPLSGTDSLFATSYQWSLISGSASISNPNSAVATFSAAPGDYTVRLTVRNGSQSDFRDVKLTVTNDPNFPAPTAVQFAQVVDILQNNPGCTAGCHLAPNSNAPIRFDDPIGALLPRVRGRANLTELAASSLLRKPAGEHHAGFAAFDLNNTAGLAAFSTIYYWILNGMPSP